MKKFRYFELKPDGPFSAVRALIFLRLSKLINRKLIYL